MSNKMFLVKMFLTESEYTLLLKIQSLIAKGLSVNKVKLEKFAKMSLKMKEEKLKELCKDINNKEKENKMRQKVSFLKSINGISELELTNRILGTEIIINKYAVLMLIMILLFATGLLRIVLFSIMIVLQMALLIKDAYRYRSLILMKEGLVTQNEVIRLYNNRDWMVMPINLRPNYRKLYVKNMADAKMQKILEDKMVGKDELEEWTNYMQLPSKIMNGLNHIMNAVKLLLLIMMILTLMKYGLKINNGIMKVKSVYNNGMSMIRKMDMIDDVKEKMDRIIEGTRPVIEKVEELKAVIEGIRPRIGEKINEQVDMIQRTMEKVANQTKSGIEKMKNEGINVKNKMSESVNASKKFAMKIGEIWKNKSSNV